MTLGLAIRMGLAPRRSADGRAATGIGIQWVCSGQVLYSVSVVIKKKNSVYSPIPVVVSSFSRKRRPVQCSARTGPRRPGNTSGPEVCRCETEQRRSDDAVPPGPAKGYAGVWTFWFGKKAKSSRCTAQDAMQLHNGLLAIFNLSAFPVVSGLDLGCPFVRLRRQ